MKIDFDPDKSEKVSLRKFPFRFHFNPRQKAIKLPWCYKSLNVPRLTSKQQNK